MSTQATKVAGARQWAERDARAECGMRAASHCLRLINEGWTLQAAQGGYVLTPPQHTGKVQQ